MCAMRSDTGTGKRPVLEKRNGGYLAGAMAQENVEIVRRAWRSYTDHGVDGAVDASSLLHGS